MVRRRDIPPLNAMVLSGIVLIALLLGGCAQGGGGDAVEFTAAVNGVDVSTSEPSDPIELSGDLGTDRATVDRLRDAGRTHAFVRWPGELAVFARHLETRARTPDFPQVVADMADRIEPLD